MFRIVLTSIFLGFFCLISCPDAIAQGAAAYTVQDVKVDILAESAVKARNEAFAKAEELAFSKLSERFWSPEERAAKKLPDLVTIAGMVSDFEITSEQLSKKRYLGTYVFRFKSSPVNRYFGHGPLGNYDAASTGGKLLVIPVFTQKNQSSLWDTKNNPWLQAWQAQNPDSVLIIPQGNVSDKMDMRDAVIAKMTRTGFKRIKARYEADDIVVAEAVFDQAASDMLAVNIYSTDSGKPQLVQTNPVPRGEATKLGELLLQGVEMTKAQLQQNWKTSFAPTKQSNAPTATASEAPQLQPAPEPYTPQAGKAKAMARFSGMADWLSMRRALNNIPPLQTIRIVGLTTNQANMELTYTDWTALSSALAARGYALLQTGTSEYSLVRKQSAN